MAIDPSWHQLVNGTAVAVDGHGVLLTGPSGSGKSDLALRLVDQGAALIADDITELYSGSGGLRLRFPVEAPGELQGRLEVRGLGIMPVSWIADAPLILVAELVPPASIDRMPVPFMAKYGDFSVAAAKITPFEASAVAKLRLAVVAAASHIMAPL